MGNQMHRKSNTLPMAAMSTRRKDSIDVLRHDDIWELQQAIEDGSITDVQKHITRLESEGKSLKYLNKRCKDKHGKTFVHSAVAHNQVAILKLLLDHKADPNAVDWQDDTPLHYACDNDSDTSELVAVLLEKGVEINPKGYQGNTPLHLASQKGNVKLVDLLLERGATVVPDQNSNTPLHLAAESGYIDVVEKLIDKLKEQGDTVTEVTGGIAEQNPEDESPLHLACRKGHLQIAELLLKSGAGVNDKDDSKATPLHEAAANGHEKVVDLLLSDSYKAHINAENKWRQRPIDEACKHGHSKVVLKLLNKKAEVGPNTLKEAIDSGHESCVMEILRSDQRDEALRHSYVIPGSQVETTPFRELIKKMPDAAESVLNHCTTHEEDTVTFSYEFVEDIVGTHPIRSEETGPTGHADEEQPFGPEDEEQSIGESVEDETDGAGDRDDKYLFKKKERMSRSVESLKVKSPQSHEHWGPTEYKKSNHPLSIMVQCGRLNLLKHPLIGSLLHRKWKIFGLGYFLNLLWYTLFLISLTVFALLVPSPLQPTCISIRSGMCDGNSSDATASGLGQAEQPCSCLLIMSDSTRNFLVVAAIILIALSASRFVFEIAQCLLLRLNYVKDWENWMEIALYVCSIVFAWVFHTECLCPFEWQWQVGVVSMFLGWITLLVFVQKFPNTGIYVLMFLSICYTFLKAVILFALLVLAFSLTFYMVFYEPQFQRSPFSSPGRAILKAMTMTTGDFDFDSLFRLSPNGERDADSDIPFPTISVMLWLIFIILMPILLTNMLVGLAVDDIKGIQEAASLKKLALQVNMVLSVEELLPNFLRLRFADTRNKVPLVDSDKEHHRLSNLWRRIQYTLWGGDYYDTHHTVSRICNRAQADLLPAERKSELEKKLDDFEVLLKAMQAKLEDLHEQNKVTKI